MVDLSKKNDSPWVVTFSPEDRLEDRLRKAAHVKPSEALLNWMEKEFIAFIHFGPNTFSGRQWGTGHEEPSTYAPAFLDPEQWVRVCADAGMKMVVFTLKHHDGFCQWFTDTTDHSIKNSPVKKDVADLLRKGCDANKVDLGIYLSPWDMNQRDRGLWNTEEYNQYFLSQLSELLTRYGRIDEIWFDGACGDYETWKNVPSYRPDSWYDYIDAVQPQAVFRMYDPYFYATEEKWEEIKTGKASLQWRGKAVRSVGNEDGKGRTDEWSVQPVFDRTIAENATFPDLGQEKYYQNAVGAVWYPLEVNTTILNQWFWNSSTATTKSLSELIEIFYNSIGNNGVLLLNISPDNTGLIPEDQISRLMELKEFIQHTFSTNLALGATVKATSETPNHKADSILDNDKMTYWTTDGEWDINTSKTTILFDLEQTRKFDNVLVQEYIREGQRVAEWSLEAWVGGSWKELVRHKTIGYKNIKRFETCTTDRVRLHILRSWDNPMICNFGLFLSSIPEEVVEENMTKEKILENVEKCISAGPFRADWDLLSAFQIPAWYQDGKFGIFIHWGVYSVPAFGSEWYPRNMYQQGTPEFDHHIATYGPQRKFGYKDFIPLFKADKFTRGSGPIFFKKRAPALWCQLQNIMMVFKCTTVHFRPGMRPAWGRRGM